MTWGFALLGAILGLSVAHGGNALAGLAVGPALGFAIAKIQQLVRRVEELEGDMIAVKQRLARQALPPAPAPEPAPAPGTAPEPPPPREAPPPAPAQPASEPAAAKPAAPQPAWPPAPARAAIAPELTNRADAAMRFARRWLTTGNVPVKIGVIVSFFGVAFLLKYAIDRHLFRVPIEWRLLTTAAAAMALLVIGWRLRARVPFFTDGISGRRR